MPKKLIFVRHGATGVSNRQTNEDGLSRLGKDQADRISRLLAEFEIGGLYTSPLRRARETAERFKNYVLPSPKIIHDLRELERPLHVYGSPLKSQLNHEYSQGLSKSFGGHFDWKLDGGGESLREFHRRVHTVKEWIESLPEDCSAFVSHAHMEAFLMAEFDPRGGTDIAAIISRAKSLYLPRGGMAILELRNKKWVITHFDRFK